MLKKIFKNKTIIILIITIIIGAIIRIIGCKWGLPIVLHPDENTIVNGAIDMIDRKSFMPNMFFRPDHFEIIINSIIFNTYSFLRYQTNASSVFIEHKEEFYLIARYFTAVFGVAMIPMAYLILSQFKKRIALIAAAIVAIFPAFVLNSHYATPDIPLTFMLMVVIYFSIQYIKKPTNKNLILISFFTALSITIKYTGAIACILIAIIVINEAIKRKNIKFIVVEGIKSIIFIILSIFIISPILILDFKSVINAFINEARPNHLGADGLGYFGNAIFYLKSFATNISVLFYIFVILGIINVYKKKSFFIMPLFLGVIYWLILSKINLHWERWALPMYITPVFLGAFGIDYILEIFKQNKILRFSSIVIISIIGINMITASFSILSELTISNTRVLSKKYCDKNLISYNNTIYEGYTPLNPTGSATIFQCFYIEDGLLKVEEEYNEAKYIILSSNMFERYYNEPQIYKEQIEIYNKIDNQYNLIKEYNPSKIRKEYFNISNIYNNVNYLIKSYKNGYVGDNIKIYEIE